MKTRYKFLLLIIIACLCSIGIYYFCEKAKPVEESMLLINTQKEIEKNLTDSNYTFDDPKVILNPYDISPLTALIVFETKDSTTVTVTIEGKDKNTTITNTFKPTNVHYLPIYGLYPDTNNKVTITMNGESKVIYIKTEKLPDDFILPTEVKADKDALGTDLYFTSPSSKGYMSAYDSNGDVRWYLTERAIWDINRLKNGHLIISSDRLINPPYYMTGLYEIDLLGKIYYEYSLSGGYHHDVYEMPNGNLLVATDNFISGTVEDYVVEIDRETGEFIKEFDLNDILPTEEGKNFDYTTDYDWFHNNSVWYDEKTNSITLSGRHQDAVINIDYNNGKLNWIIGDPTNWSKDMKKYFFTPEDKDFVWQYAQHAAMILPNGNVFIFDNGNNKSKLEEDAIKADDNYSRGVIFDINTNDMTIKEVWQYGKEKGSKYYSPYISDVDYLNENHYLINFGGYSELNGKVNNTPAGLGTAKNLTTHIVEIKNNKELFKLVLPTNIYRAEKLSLYANDTFVLGEGKSLGTLGETETSKYEPILIFNKDASEVIEKYNIKFVKEDDRLAVTGTFDKSDEVYIVLDNVFSKKSYQMIISSKPYTALCVDLGNNKELTVTKYINDVGLYGKYYLYMKINGKVYDFDLYVDYN